MAEAEVLRFDRRGIANRALLVSPPHRGADCPMPVSGLMLSGERLHHRAHLGFTTSLYASASQFNSVTLVALVRNAETARLLALLQ